MSSIKKYILEQVAGQALSRERAKQLLSELDAGTATPRSTDSDGAREPIAIVGMAGRFPRAGDAEAFWRVLRNGLACIGDFPAARKADFEHILRNPHYTEFLIDTTVPPEHVEHAHAPAGYLEEIDKFDAAFFGIPPAESAAMDPHQRLALEVSFQAMEDAGYGGQCLHGSNTGVFIGKEGTNYSLYRYCTASHPLQLTGSWESVMASRISYLFDFHGPCMLIDTACSAGLVSIHMAVQSMLNGECDQALAGGINLSITGEFGRGFQGSMAMDAVESEDSVIRTFDARANGTVWGEGVAMVMLKPLSRALADRDHVHAVILGSAINNDGASSGLTAPDAETQEQVIVRAWEKAGIDPATLGYVEAHGTGTVLGDPIEFKGLTAAFRRFTDKRQFCAIGSLKTNMGHLVGASGVASLFKVVKSIEHRELAPTINFGQPNPYINFVDGPLYVSDALRPWQAPEGPRRAALSSFGFSHTNCHMVVEEAPAVTPAPHAQAGYCLTVSARERHVLLEFVERLRTSLQREPADVADVCYTLNVGRGHYAHRLAIVVTDAASLLEGLALAPGVIAEGAEARDVYYASHTIVSDRQRDLASGELTERARKALAEDARRVVTDFRDGGGTDLERLRALAELYARGAEVDWDTFYAGEPRHRCSLPPYPLERVRVWADPKISRLADTEQPLHPLVQRLAQHDADEHRFESRFRVDSQWVLADHRIKGTCVVPGTTYLEMARAAAAEAYGWERIALADVFFLAPMVVAEDETRHVRLRLTAGDGDARFEIESRPGDGEWERHVEGKLAPCAAREAVLDLAAVKHAATETIEHFEAETDTGVFQFGAHWDCIRSAWRVGEDALARLALPRALAHESAVFALHPSMLDNAVNLISQSSDSTYLPFSYKSFELYAPLPEEIHSHVVSRTRAHRSDETLAYDVTLTDAEGRVLARIDDYVVKKVGSFAGLGGVDDGADGEYLLPHWTEQALPATDDGACRRLLVLGAGAPSRHTPLLAGLHSHGIAAELVRLGEAAEMQGQGSAVNAACLCVDAPGAFASFAAGVPETVDGIVFVADDADEVAVTLADVERFARRRRTGVDALFRLTRALLEAKVTLPWGLAVLTREAFAVDGSETALDPSGASAIALGSVISMEYPGLPCRLLDTPAGGDAAAMAGWLLAAPPGRVVALRERDCGLRPLLRELRAQQLEAPSTPAHPREDGCYLITGGLGGLGLATARDLAERGKVRLVLSARSVLAPPEQWATLAAGDGPEALRYAALVELSQRTAALEYVPCDLADPAGVEALLARAREAHGPLRGIYHLAGVAGDGYLLRKDFGRFDAVLRPKVEGLRNLYAATAGDDLERFVVFSSIVALGGGEGQGDYAAANAFMDAFAWRARQEGRRLVSIDWPSWREIGMAADYAVSEDESPFRALDPADAFARLERIVAHAPVQIVAASVNPPAMAAVEAALPFTLSAELRRRLPRVDPPAPDSADHEVVIRGKQAEDLSEIEVVLAKVYGAVLGLSEVDVFANFYDLGGNSIIATHLLKLIDAQFPGVVDISDVFSYASIDDMAAYIAEQTGAGQSAAASSADPAQPAQAGWEAMLERAVEDDAAIDAILERFDEVPS